MKYSELCKLREMDLKRWGEKSISHYTCLNENINLYTGIEW